LIAKEALLDGSKYSMHDIMYDVRQLPASKLWCGWNLCRSTTDKRWGVLCQFSV